MALNLTGNVTGWNNLMQGKIVESSWDVFNNATNGYLPAMLFFTLSAALYIRTKNPALVMGIQLIFLLLFNTYFTGIGFSAAVLSVTVMVGLWFYENFIQK